MGHNTTVMQASDDIEPSSIHAGRLEMASGVYPHMIPHTTPPHHMHSRSQMPQGEMIHPLYVIDGGLPNLFNAHEKRGEAWYMKSRV